MIFTLIHLLRRKVIETQTGEHRVELRLLTIPSKYFANKEENKQPSFLKNLWYSTRLSIELLCKLKIGQKDTAINGNKIDKSIIVVEWFLGYVILAYFVITLANVSPLVNRLISGVF